MFIRPLRQYCQCSLCFATTTVQTNMKTNSKVTLTTVEKLNIKKGRCTTCPRYCKRIHHKVHVCPYLNNFLYLWWSKLSRHIFDIPINGPESQEPNALVLLGRWNARARLSSGARHYVCMLCWFDSEPVLLNPGDFWRLVFNWRLVFCSIPLP